MKYVYLLKNNLTRTYSDPIVRFEGFDDLCKQHHNFMILYPQKAQEQFLNISTLVYVGTFDDSTGKIQLFEDSAVMSYNLQDSWEQIKALEVKGNA